MKINELLLLATNINKSDCEDVEQKKGNKRLHSTIISFLISF